MKTNAITQIQTTTSTFNPHNIPWPSPLEYEGDIRENVEVFETTWKNYCIATGMDQWGEDKQTQRTSLMLSAIGTGAMKKYMDFGLTDQDKVSDSNAFKKIKSCILSRSNVIFDRYMFNSCNQLQHETFDQYLIRLQKLLKYCNYRDTEMSKELLRDRIVVGIMDDRLKICKISEVTQCRISTMKTFEGYSTSHTEVPVNKIQSSTTRNNKSTNRKKCKFCTKYHEFKKELCSAYGQICSFCKEKNHIEDACRKKWKTNDKRQNDRNRVNEINLQQGDKSFIASDDETEHTLIAKIEDVNTTSNNTVMARLHLKFGRNWKIVDCMIDTGSNTCLIGENQYKKYMSGDHLNIEKSSRGLIDFNGNPIESVGEVRVKSAYWKTNLIF